MSKVILGRSGGKKGVLRMVRRGTITRSEVYKKKQQRQIRRKSKKVVMNKSDKQKPDGNKVNVTEKRERDRGKERTLTASEARIVWDIST